MSTTSEVIVACQSEMKVFAFSLITNKCVTQYEDAEANHEEVVQTGRDCEAILRTFVSRIVRHIAQIEGLK
jgi:purine-nucleoside phosphorylase